MSFFLSPLTLHIVCAILRYGSYLPEPCELGEGGVFMNQYEFSDRLYQLCKEKHITTTQLAEAIGRSPRQVNRYRNGQCKNISLEVLTSIADALNISLSDLLQCNTDKRF